MRTSHSYPTVENSTNSADVEKCNFSTKKNEIREATLFVLVVFKLKKEQQSLDNN